MAVCLEGILLGLNKHRHTHIPGKRIIICIYTYVLSWLLYVFYVPCYRKWRKSPQCWLNSVVLSIGCQPSNQWIVYPRPCYPIRSRPPEMLVAASGVVTLTILQLPVTVSVLVYKILKLLGAHANSWFHYDKAFLEQWSSVLCPHASARYNESQLQHFSVQLLRKTCKSVRMRLCLA